jgi:hypothetical protein
MFNECSVCTAERKRRVKGREEESRGAGEKEREREVKVQLGIKLSVLEVLYIYIYDNLMHHKNLCKCYNVPPPSIIIIIKRSVYKLEDTHRAT